MEWETGRQSERATKERSDQKHRAVSPVHQREALVTSAPWPRPSQWHPLRPYRETVLKQGWLRV